MSNELIVIGICGLKYAGKDTVADYLVENHKFIKLSFAGELKKLCEEAVGNCPPPGMNAVLAVEQVYNFRTDAFPIRTFGRCNIAFGDPVFYNDTEAIDATFDPTGLNLVNTVRATAHKITYTVSKGVDGPGGFIRDIELITRLYPV